ncbi:LuxR C-terminal-related transcriptional regulator [Phascolarctobacterium sp.]
MTKFTPEENSRIVSFFAKAVSSRTDFRKTILEAFSSIFGYKRCTFWLANNNGRLVEPMYINVSDKIMQAWEDGYYRYDPFDYANLPKQYRRQGTLVVTDLVDEMDYLKQNVYYNDILAAQDYVHKMALYLMDGERFIGGMSFLRNKQEAPFGYGDKLLVSYLGHYISQLLTEQSQIDKLRSENAQLLEFADLSGDGLIIADAQSKICYINAGGRNIYDKLLLHGQIESLEDLICGVRYQECKIPGSNHMSYCELGRYGIHTKVKMVLQEKFYSIIFQQKSDGKVFADKRWEALLQEKGLTSREREVLDCVLKGMTNVEIAAELFVSIHTIKAHLYSIYHKFDVGSRSALMARFSQQNYR